MTVEPVESRPKRIAILGGGPAALAAAHELTMLSGWEKLYEVHVYQMGWRLGGKCASGRGACDRVEEHGLHIFQGWYNNAFWMVQNVYAERARLGLSPKSPFQKWEDGFNREDAMIMVEYIRERAKLHHWTMAFPENCEVPGEGPPSTWTMLSNAVGVLISVAVGALVGEDVNPCTLLLMRGLGKLNDVLRVDRRPGQENEIPGRIQELMAGIAAATGNARGLIAELLELLCKVLHVIEGVAAAVDLEDARCALALVELGVVSLIGILRDVWDPEVKKFDYYSNLEQVDFREWLRKHGASEMALEAGLVRFIYNATFSNLSGDCDGGTFAAGTALRAMVQMLGYRGSLVWQPRAGVGDTVIAPLYQVLDAKGVNFHFFERVEEVHHSETGSIERVSMGRQVRLAAGKYQPLVPLPFDDGSVLDAWPAQPRYEQLDPEQARRLQEGQIDLESPWADWQSEPWDLVRGTDFDDVILCIPVAALRDVCPSIIAHSPVWSGMVENIATIPTLAMQLWIKPTLRELGMDVRRWALASKSMAPNCEVYVDPLSSWTDCSSVLEFEHWPANNRPQTLVYYCGAMGEAEPVAPYTDHAYPARQVGLARTISLQWLNDNMGYFWPLGTCLRRPRGLHLPLLVCPSGPGATAKEKYEGQYFRANVSPTERYTLCPPAQRQWRIDTHETGFDNLYVAGDWVRHAGVNAGFFEGAAISGREAVAAYVGSNFATRSAELPPILIEGDTTQGVLPARANA
ncbi:MAG: hypothetical protein JWM10_3812 [Myxococcaceae bacterium]|nr:hypothetical protein [Myxococcaceae bacterium]